MILNIVIKIIVKEVGNIIFIYDSNTIVTEIFKLLKYT